MKQLLAICAILIIFVGGILIFQDALLYKLGRIWVVNELASDSECDIEKITQTIETFVKAYNQGQITASSDYFSRDFQWFSDTELVDGKQVDHFVTYASHKELLAHFQTQYELGQTIQITYLKIHGGSWHGDADIEYRGRSKTSDGMGVLIGKGMVDCQTQTIAVWSMATHHPNMMPLHQGFHGNPKAGFQTTHEVLPISQNVVNV